MGLRGFLTTLALGAGAMYLLDPERGEQRRDDMGRHFERFSRDAEGLWRDGVADLEQRAETFRTRAQSATEGGVQQVTGAARQAAGNLQQAAQDVTETGEGMQTRFSGNGSAGGKMAPGPRLLAITGGSLLTLYGRTQRGLKGGAFTALGLNLLTKGMANKSLPQIVQRTKSEGLEALEGLTDEEFEGQRTGQAEMTGSTTAKGRQGGRSGQGGQRGDSMSASSTQSTSSRGESRPADQAGEGQDLPGGEPAPKKPGNETSAGE